MVIHSTRFGLVETCTEDVLRFPEGLLGLAECRDWILLADLQNEAVVWMQSIERPEIAVALVSPCRFVLGFQMRVARRELEPLGLDDVRAAQVLVMVSKTGRAVTLNLKAPLVMNAQRRVGRQVITNGELPMQYEVTSASPALKQSASGA